MLNTTTTAALMKIAAAFIISFLIGVALLPKLIPVLHRLKFGQVESVYALDSHKKKQGTPTMGGIAFVISSTIAAIVVNYATLKSPYLWLLLFAFVANGAIGLLDDYLIVVRHDNQGLRAKYKFGLQSLVAIIFYVLAMKLLPNFSTAITIPIAKTQIELGWFYPVLVYFMFTSTTNGVNLSDGLDGLATGLTMMAIAPFVVFALMMKNTATCAVGTAVIGGLLAFMMFNYHPAKIFMGDSGSLALGGVLAALAVATKQELLLAIIGGVYAIEAGSVVLQVISYKTTGKRIFRMSPIHHHFELCGFEETQVVLGFWFAGFLFGIIGCLLGVL